MAYISGLRLNNTRTYMVKSYKKDLWGFIDVEITSGSNKYTVQLCEYDKTSLDIVKEMAKAGVSGVGSSKDDDNIYLFAISQDAYRLGKYIEFDGDYNSVCSMLLSSGSTYFSTVYNTTSANVVKVGDRCYFDGVFNPSTSDSFVQANYRNLHVPESIILSYLWAFRGSPLDSVNRNIDILAGFYDKCISRGDLESYGINMSDYVGSFPLCTDNGNKRFEGELDDSGFIKAMIPDGRVYMIDLKAQFQVFGCPVYINDDYIYIAYGSSSRKGIKGVLKYKIVDKAGFKSFISKYLMLKKDLDVDLRINIFGNSSFHVTEDEYRRAGYAVVY